LARDFLKLKEDHTPIHYFDLENPLDLMRLNEPLLQLENLDGLIIIDEIQRRPEFFPHLIDGLVGRRLARARLWPQLNRQ
jgi:predicted AAA+ superfamily ATPase